MYSSKIDQEVLHFWVRWSSILSTHKFSWKLSKNSALLYSYWCHNKLCRDIQKIKDYLKLNLPLQKKS